MAQLDIQLFGFPTLLLAGEAAVVDTRKALALVAYLAMTGQPQSRDTLAAFLWPDYDEDRGRAALRRTLSALRAALKGYGLEIGRQALALEPSADWRVDVLEFRRLLELADSHHLQPTQSCPRCLLWREEAVAYYQEDFLAGFTLRDSATFDDWQLQESENLRLFLGRALEKLVAGRMRQGPQSFPAAIKHARRWLLVDPLREEAHRQLMRLYAWSGRRADALRQYRDCLRTLEQELGVRPLAETTALYHAIMEERLPAPEFDGLPAVEAPSPGETTPEPAGSLPFIGRVAELNAIREHYDRMGKRGFLMAVIGEAGVGKTRLAETFVAGATARLMVGRCYESEVHLALGCFGQAIRDALVRADSVQRLSGVAPHWLAETGRLIPELATSFPDLPLAPPMSGPGAQSRFMEGVAQVIAALCDGEQPGVLFLDDVQWADEASLDLLTYLAHRLHRLPLFVLLTWRDDVDDREQRLRQLLAEGERAGEAGRILLSRLTREEVDELVSGAGLPPITGLSSRLYQETEGLPYFLVEYLAMLRRNGGEPDWSLPRGVRDLLQVRLAQSSETAQQVLQAAAVIGRVFTFELVLAAAGRSADETLAGLEMLAARGLISELPDKAPKDGGPKDGGPRDSAPRDSAPRDGGPGDGGPGDTGPGAGAPLPVRRTVEPQYDFRHHKLRQVVYEDVNLARRRILHHRIAEAMESRARRAPRPEAMAGLIAQHFLLAGDEPQAAEFSRQAGDYAGSLYANREALAHYQTALALGHPTGPALRETCGDLYTRLGEYGSALESYEAALAAGDGEHVARLEHRLAQVHQLRGEWEAAESYLTAAWAGLDGDSARRAALLADWSRNAFRQDELERAQELAERAQRFAADAGSDAALAQIHNMLGMLSRRRGAMAEARDHLERSLALTEGDLDPGPRVAALNNLALLYAEEGRPADGLIHLEKALALCRAVGDRHREAALLNNMADLLHNAGRSDDALARLTESVAIYAEIGKERGEWQPEIWKLTEW